MFNKNAKSKYSMSMLKLGFQFKKVILHEDFESKR